jgi:hypothetical protein
MVLSTSSSDPSAIAIEEAEQVVADGYSGASFAVCWNHMRVIALYGWTEYVAKHTRYKKLILFWSACECMTGHKQNRLEHSFPHSKICALSHTFSLSLSLFLSLFFLWPRRLPRWNTQLLLPMQAFLSSCFRALSLSRNACLYVLSDTICRTIRSCTWHAPRCLKAARSFATSAPP